MCKVLAKVLTYWLKRVTGNVISKTQTAFIKGCPILDVIFTVNGIVDKATRLKRISFSSRLILKRPLIRKYLLREGHVQDEIFC